MSTYNPFEYYYNVIPAQAGIKDLSRRGAIYRAQSKSGNPSADWRTVESVNSISRLIIVKEPTAERWGTWRTARIITRRGAACCAYIIINQIIWN